MEKLTQAVGDLGHHDAVAVLFRVFAAIDNPNGRAPGQARTNREALAEMARAAGTAPDGEGRPVGAERIAFDNLVQYVETNRRKRKTFRRDPEPTGLDDETLVTSLVWFWVQSIGVPPTASGADQPTFARIVLEERDTLRKLARVTSRNATKLVAAVHRELGYVGTDKILASRRSARKRTKQT